MDLYVEHICFPVTNLGPGRRVGLWVQGCRRHCPGCLSPELFARRESGRRTAADVAHAILTAGDSDGLTVSGGEPFDQAAALSEVLTEIRRVADLEVMVYSGYLLEELREIGGARSRLLGQIDLLVDGPFRRAETNARIWRGSDNQRLHLLTPRARRHRARVRREYGPRRELHYAIDHEGRLLIIGIPQRGFRREFARAAAAGGIALDEEASRT